MLTLEVSRVFSPVLVHNNTLQTVSAHQGFQVLIVCGLLPFNKLFVRI